MRIYISLLLGLLFLLSALSAIAAPSFIGPTGLIFLPDDNVTPRREFNVFYHAVFEDVGFGSTQHYWGANLGLIRDVELGFTGATDVIGSGTDFLVNGKWRIVPETGNRPGVALGVLDTFDQLNGPTVYFSVGKDFAPMIGRMTGANLPIRLNAGYGSGLYRHGFIGANWTFSPKIQLMAEYVGTRIPASSDTGGNIGIRYAATPGLRIDAALLDFQNFSIGFSYSSAFGGLCPR